MTIPIAAIAGKVLDGAEKTSQLEVSAEAMETAKEVAEDLWPDTEVEQTPQQISPADIGKEVWQGFEETLKENMDDYFRDLFDKSECKDTLSKKPFDISDLKKLTPEENAKMREQFSELKSLLKKQWEEQNGRPWPTYDHDIYSANGKLIRKQGMDYDAHHVQPLGLGGKNEVGNITPLNAEVHYDKQGIHAPDSPYSKMDKMLGGIGE